MYAEFFTLDPEKRKAVSQEIDKCLERAVVAYWQNKDKPAELATKYQELAPDLFAYMPQNVSVIDMRFFGQNVGNADLNIRRPNASPTKPAQWNLADVDAFSGNFGKRP